MMERKKMLAVLAQTTGVGIIAGMRSMTAPAIVGHMLAVQRPTRLTQTLRWLVRPQSIRVLNVLAGSELVADKLPNTPDRTMAPSLAWRVTSGALSAAAWSYSRRSPVVLGGLAGAVAAVGGAYAFMGLRKSIVERLHIPDTIVGLGEDALAIAGGYLLLRPPAR